MASLGAGKWSWHTSGGKVFTNLDDCVVIAAFCYSESTWERPVSFPLDLIVTPTFLCISIFVKDIPIRETPPRTAKSTDVSEIRARFTRALITLKAVQPSQRDGRRSLRSTTLLQSAFEEKILQREPLWQQCLWILLQIKRWSEFSFTGAVHSAPLNYNTSKETTEKQQFQCFLQWNILESKVWGSTVSMWWTLDSQPHKQMLIVLYVLHLTVSFLQ